MWCDRGGRGEDTFSLSLSDPSGGDGVALLQQEHPPEGGREGGRVTS